MTLRVPPFLLLPPLPPAAPAAEPAPKPPEDLVGSWSLAPASSDGASSGPGTITLMLTLDQGKLAGVAVLPLPQGQKRWPLLNPPLHRNNLFFQGDNRASLPAGGMEAVGGGGGGG